MNLQNIRNDIASVIQKRGLTMYGFAVKHGISYSTLAKFVNGDLKNPRFSTLTAITHAVATERRRAS